MTKPLTIPATVTLGTPVGDTGYYWKNGDIAEVKFEIDGYEIEVVLTVSACVFQDDDLRHMAAKANKENKS